MSEDIAYASDGMRQWAMFPTAHHLIPSIRISMIWRLQLSSRDVDGETDMSVKKDACDK